MERRHTVVRRQPPARELGRCLIRHHPIEPWLALILCSLPSVVIGSGLWLGATGSLPLGFFAFVLTAVLLIGLFAESLFVRQELYEHGLLLASIVPLTPAYVIPYATIDHESIAVAGYRRPSDPVDAFGRQYRQAPFVGTVTFVALGPRPARALLTGTATWARTSESTRWYVSFRDNDAVAATLRERVPHQG